LYDGAVPFGGFSNGQILEEFLKNNISLLPSDLCLQWRRPTKRSELLLLHFRSGLQGLGETDQEEENWSGAFSHSPEPLTYKIS
jgi:hypothetical protein